VPHGFGVRVYGNGDVWEGEWIEGKRVDARVGLGDTMAFFGVASPVKGSSSSSSSSSFGKQ